VTAAAEGEGVASEPVGAVAEEDGAAEERMEEGAAGDDEAISACALGAGGLLAHPATTISMRTARPITCNSLRAGS
jgi:hypothetical protein